jgi:hypothetical protein
MIAFGALFLANPDLPRRLAADGPFNTPDPATFYGGDHRGYTDYLALTSTFESRSGCFSCPDPRKLFVWGDRSMLDVRAEDLPVGYAIAVSGSAAASTDQASVCPAGRECSRSLAGSVSDVD